MTPYDFTEDQIERYSRHIILPNVGGKGQRTLLRSKALVLGAGGLGSPAALYLTTAGVGTLGIVDCDTVELSNLNRQILHSTKEVGVNKTDSAKWKLKNLNPDVNVINYHLRVHSSNIFDLIGGYDVVLDGTDNFPARFLINDACVMAKKPLIHAGVFRFEGQAMTILPGKGPCYRCVFSEPPPPGLVPSCQEAGILGSIAGILGAIQATEAIKVLLGIGEPLVGRLFLFDALEMQARTITIPRDTHCAVCGKHPTITKLIDYEETCETDLVKNE
ncbi:MAG: molybdopterin-synthase adenylyltransferase MoeB [Candidatus Omnitrophota bacterium]|jgi:adenylyltransferase/sulfurtransferase|nr:MAG: molybdopterin-synthase adenylyltransferase MoeB [Candidatus Omnitrophota bacterium]